MSLQKELEQQVRECEVQWIVCLVLATIGAIGGCVLLAMGIWHFCLGGFFCALAFGNDFTKKEKEWRRLKIELEKAKENDPAHKYCPQCGSAIPAGKNFCVECGEHLPGYGQVRKCRKCGSLIPNNKNFCVECGEHL